MEFNMIKSFSRKSKKENLNSAKAKSPCQLTIFKEQDFPWMLFKKRKKPNRFKMKS